MLVVKNYFKLIGHHQWPIHCLGIRYAVYDIEPWSYTPKLSYQKDNPVYWIGRTTSLARSNGISIGLDLGFPS